jgi:4-amino-4-deoxy-L-arabinose transferase-like glycosyltransferase
MRQLYEAPWAEFCIAHFFLLSGGDRLSAIVQWWSMFGSILGVSLIAQQLGADRRGQIFAVVFAGTLPMGILQASSTQNDYAVTFWLVCFVHFLLAFRERPEVQNSLGIGASLGLAMLTKATTYVYALPFLILLALWAWCHLHWRVWEAAVVLGSVPIAINIAYYLRNLLAFNALFGPRAEVALYANARFTPSTLISNSLRDLALQVGTPSTRANAAIVQGLRALFSALHLNINDPATSWAPFQFTALSFHEDYAGNPLHLLVIVAVLMLCIAAARLRSDRLLVTYVVTLIGVFFVFALYLKWQPWSSRLELVLFVLFAPACGVVLTRVSPRIGLNVLAIVLTLAAIPWVVKNQSRPLTGPNSILTTPRTAQYFTNRHALEAPYAGAARYLQGSQCTTVGLEDNIDDWEYPLWRLLNHGTQRVEFEHILVHNETSDLADVEPYVSFHPCAIVAIRQKQGSIVDYHGSNYHAAWSSSVIVVYLEQT